MDYDLFLDNNSEFIIKKRILGMSLMQIENNHNKETKYFHNVNAQSYISEFNNMLDSIFYFRTYQITQEKITESKLIELIQQYNNKHTIIVHNTQNNLNYLLGKNSKLLFQIIILNLLFGDLDNPLELSDSIIEIYEQTIDHKSSDPKEK